MKIASETEASFEIDSSLDAARQKEELKVKILLVADDDETATAAHWLVRALHRYRINAEPRVTTNSGQRTPSSAMKTYNFRIDGIEFELLDASIPLSKALSPDFCATAALHRQAHFFEGMDAVLFMASLSDYDEKIMDTTTTTPRRNRSAKSTATTRVAAYLDFVRLLSQETALKNTSKVLILQNRDAFAKKIVHTDISDQEPFSDYRGPPQDVNSGVLYFIEKFKEAYHNAEQDSFNFESHIRVAADENNGEEVVEFLMDSTRTIILTENLVRSGFLRPKPWAVLEISKECIVRGEGGDLFHQWSEPRDAVPRKLAKLGVSPEDWSSTWDCVHGLMVQTQERSRRQNKWRPIKKRRPVLVQAFLDNKAEWLKLAAKQRDIYQSRDIEVSISFTLFDESIDVPCGLRFQKPRNS